jgi:hypothetical protein
MQLTDRHVATSPSLVVFGCVWTVSIVLHRIAFPEQLVRPLGFVSLAMALLALSRPHDLHFLALAVAASGALVASELPDVANHQYAELIIDVGLLICWAPALFGRTSGAAASLSLVRVTVIGMYAWAVLHKLNTSYLDVDVSCGTHVWDTTAGRLPFVGDIDLLRRAVIPASFVLELIIPLLLCLRRWRIVGIAVGLLFHGVLAVVPLHGVSSFSGLMVATYAAFLTEAQAAQVIDVVSAFVVRVHLHRLRVPWLLAVLPLTLAAVVIAHVSPLTNVRLARVAAANIALGCLAAVCLLARRSAAFRRAGPPAGPATAQVLERSISAAVGVIVLVSGALPYLGHRTEMSFSMFSNLRTEGDSNHVFLPTLHVFGYQERLVTVLEAPDELDDLARSDVVIPAFELARRLAAVTGDATLVVSDGGPPERLDDAALRARFPAPTVLERKLVRMREIEPRGPVSCRH